MGARWSGAGTRHRLRDVTAWLLGHPKFAVSARCLGLQTGRTAPSPCAKIELKAGHSDTIDRARRRRDHRDIAYRGLQLSLLGYLVPRIAASGPERAATQALAYLLNSRTEIAEAFVDFMGRTGIKPFRPGRILAEEQHGQCIPDLTIRDRDDVIRIFVENKFWAGLMKGQPVAYLKKLPAEESSLLVFIVPHQRMYGLWVELREKCKPSSVDLGTEEKGIAIYWARERHGPRTLAITSWKQVLLTLEQAADDKGHAGLRADIVQLQGLTDQMDADAFLPLREEEVTDVNVARRMINYTGLIDEIVAHLNTDGVADTKGLLTGCSYAYAGRYLRLHEKFELWLGVNQLAWRDRGITPLWIQGKFVAVEGGIGKVGKLFDDAHEKDGWLCIPIRLTARVDRQRVIDDAVRQVNCIAERLLETFPGG